MKNLKKEDNYQDDDKNWSIFKQSQYEMDF